MFANVNTRKCEACPEGCNVCTDSNTCTSCDIVGGYRKQGSLCTACSIECKTC